MTAFDRLEQQVHVLIERCRCLQAENRELRSLYQAQLRREQELSAKLRLACARVETMLERIRAFEASQHHAGQPTDQEDSTDVGYP